MLTEFPFDIDALKQGEDLFPSAIADDPWIAYHGTSGRNARSIEQNGLQGSMGALARKDLEAVAAVFDAMSWHGEIHDRYSVLKPWSLEFDRARGPKIFLAESSVRAALYATQSCAGGEAMRAGRFCLADLERYIADPEIRRRHRRKRKQIAQGTVSFKQPKLVWVDFSDALPPVLRYRLECWSAARPQQNAGGLPAEGPKGTADSAQCAGDVRAPIHVSEETCDERIHLSPGRWLALEVDPGVVPIATETVWV